MAPQITANLNLDSKGFQTGIKQAETSTKKLDGTMSGVSKTMGKALSAVGQTAFAALAAGVAATVATIYKAVPAAMEAQAAIDDLDNTLRNRLGKTYKQLQPQIEAMASSMQKAFGFGDEDAKVALSQLITSGMSFEKAMNTMQLVADVAAKKNMTLAESAKAVGLASQGNTRGLREMGIIVKSTGDRTKDAALAMAQLHKTADGAAQALASRNPFRAMNEMVGELFETIGVELLPVVKDIVKELTGVVGGEGAQSKAKAFGKALADGFREAWTWAKAIAGFFTNADWSRVFVEAIKLFIKLAWDGAKVLGHLLLVGIGNALPGLGAMVGQAVLELLSDILGPKISKLMGFDKGAARLAEFSKKSFADGKANANDALTRFGEDSREDIAQFTKNTGLAGIKDNVAAADAANRAKEASTPSAAEMAAKVAAVKASQAQEAWQAQRMAAMSGGDRQITINLAQSNPTHAIMS